MAGAAGLEPGGQDLCNHLFCCELSRSTGRAKSQKMHIFASLRQKSVGEGDRFDSPLDHIRAGQAEMACGSEQTGVVRIDLFEAVFGGTGQVKSIGCAQHDGSRKRRIHTREPGNDRHGERQPSKSAQFALPVELAKQGGQVAAAKGSLPELAMECSYRLSSTMYTAGHAICPGQRADLFPSRVLYIQPRHVAGIKVNHASDSSRSSEIPTVLSVPRDSFPVAASLRKAGKSIRREK